MLKTQTPASGSRSTAAPAPACRRVSFLSARVSAATSARETALSLQPSDAVLGMLERARLDALLRLRPVVLLHVVADPGVDLRRHRDAVDRMPAIEPATGLVEASGHMQRQSFLIAH